MPECYWLSKYGYCPGGDECLYYHPREKKRNCEDYKRGFCWLGECPTHSYQFSEVLSVQTLTLKALSLSCVFLPSIPPLDPAGPNCPRTHVPLQLCTLYASGFCPFGPSCTSGHPKDDLPPLAAYRPPTPQIGRAHV